MKWVMFSIAILILSGCNDHKCRPEENCNAKTLEIKIDQQKVNHAEKI